MDDLDKRIEQARKNSEEKLPILDQKSTEDDNETDNKGARAGSEFLASVFAGAFIGFGIDWFFSSTPWGMMFFILMGFVSAVMRANAAMKAANEETTGKNGK